MISLENFPGGLRAHPMLFLILFWRYALSFRNYPHLFLHHYPFYYPNLCYFSCGPNTATILLAFLALIRPTKLKSFDMPQPPSWFTSISNELCTQWLLENLCRHSTQTTALKLPFHLLSYFASVYLTPAFPH